ncbi:hypothetical protein [Photobacterium andalusiense]|uniref:Uncharacterized protein n=1 Tax=Photobacterium andalusiense TaxID=2204296 RepID=A0A1Y6MCG4_9GAMM|nr:hypothetical protein [Photobacterium andalusiense]SMY34255.1 hypothetical protein PAND9192_01238 [Photobacterium andalusiense]
MEKVGFDINKDKYRLHNKLKEIRVAILTGDKKLPQLFIELEAEQKRFEKMYL